MTEWKKARKKPIVIEYREAEGLMLLKDNKWGECIETREGTLYAYEGEDFIIKGVKGEIYPINKRIFKETYEVLDEKCWIKRN